MQAAEAIWAPLSFVCLHLHSPVAAVSPRRGGCNSPPGTPELSKVKGARRIVQSSGVCICLLVDGYVTTFRRPSCSLRQHCHTELPFPPSATLNAHILSIPAGSFRLTSTYLIICRARRTRSRDRLQMPPKAGVMTAIMSASPNAAEIL